MTMAIRVVTMVIAMVVVGLWLWVGLRSRRWRWIALLPVSYALHILIFYTAVIFKLCAVVNLNQWSSGIRLQGLLLLILLGVYAGRARRWTIQ